jgi:hypothetical protein
MQKIFELIGNLQNEKSFVSTDTPLMYVSPPTKTDSQTDFNGPGGSVFRVGKTF